jgi:hypothetical protein
MPSGLKRHQTSGHDHFLTFTCYHRLPYLNDDHSSILFEQAAGRPIWVPHLRDGLIVAKVGSALP